MDRQKVMVEEVPQTYLGFGGRAPEGRQFIFRVGENCEGLQSAPYGICRKPFK